MALVYFFVIKNMYSVTNNFFLFMNFPNNNRRKTVKLASKTFAYILCQKFCISFIILTNENISQLG